MSPLFQFLYVLLLVVFACAKVTLQGAGSRRCIRTAGDSMLFNAAQCGFMALFLWLLFGFGGADGTTVLWALAVSSMSVAFQIIYAIALREGPVSLTVVIVNFNVFLTTVFSALVFHESLHVSQLIGVLLLVLSMLLSVKNEPGGKKISRKWVILTIASLIACGTANNLQKYYSVTYDAGEGMEASTFLVCVYGIGMVLAAAAWSVKAFLPPKDERRPFRVGAKFVLPFAAAIGLILSIYQKLLMRALMVIDGTFLFPTYAGSQSLAMSFIGVLFFHDRLTKRQWMGVLCGVLSVVCMNLRFGPALG